MMLNLSLIETMSVQISAGAVVLTGDLCIPQGAQGLVLFAHGSGSSRFHPRNRFVAQVLQAGGLATLLFDLLTTAEEELDTRTRQLRFNVDFLASRLVAATDWVLRHRKTQPLRIGYFGTRTGTAAALAAAAQRSEVIAAVASSGGRPDLALPVLGQVKTPTLLLVGGYDQFLIEMNQLALARLPTIKSLEIVPGAGHRYEEPGALEAVARHARAWFQHHLTAYSSGSKRTIAKNGIAPDR